jgi:hypothetical protein
MPNKEIYLIEIVDCADERYWYNDLIGSTFYVVVDYGNMQEGIKFKVINNPDYPLNYIDYKDSSVLEKVTKVLVPQVNNG